jgi:hypothetical protein
VRIVENDNPCSETYHLSKTKFLNHLSRICVITHTNVAVEEIKTNWILIQVYFGLPKSFWNNQSVVDKFITIPAYKTNLKKLSHDSVTMNLTMT